MIEVLSGFPSQVSAFLCSGHVTRHDYDTVLIPAVMEALETHPKIRLYYETTPDFQMDTAAMWEDFKFGIEHIGRWEQLAVVTDLEWIKLAGHAFGFLFPGRLRIFPHSDVALAREWIIM